MLKKHNHLKKLYFETEKYKNHKVLFKLLKNKKVF